MRIFVLILMTLLGGPALATATSPMALYGDRIEFDVVRKGEIVGEHVTRFSQIDDELRVTSNMTIDIYVLFLPVYAFDYKTVETWASDKMISLDVSVIDGSDRLNFKAQRNQYGLEIHVKDKAPVAVPSVLTTNHWNADVIHDTQVLNTLTGNVNRVAITPMGSEKVEVSGGTVNASRYDYSGDLTDTSVWYDAEGRWVKLRFLARDGSTIEYRCRTCKPES